MGFERVRRLNEPREETPLCETQQCIACALTIEGGGMSIGARWLHLGCVEGYFESLEGDVRRLFAENQALRAAAQSTPQWTPIPGGWQMVTTGNLTVATTNLTFASSPTIDWWSTIDYSSGSAYRGLITTSAGGLEKSLGP